VIHTRIPLSELQKYVGRYGGAAGAAEFTILIRNQRLAVRLPNNTSFDLLPPDAAGRRATRANLGLGVTFEESPTGAVSAMNLQRLLASHNTKGSWVRRDRLPRKRRLEALLKELDG
jgi:hypothetical protein